MPKPGSNSESLLIEALNETAEYGDRNSVVTTIESAQESVDRQEPIDRVEEGSGIVVPEDEKILRDYRPSWVNWGGLIILGLLTIWFGVGIVFFIAVWVARRKSRYVVTNRRIIHKKGLLRTKTAEYHIRDIRHVQTGQTFTERLMGVGNLTIDPGRGPITMFGGVPNHQDVARTIGVQRRKRR